MKIYYYKSHAMGFLIYTTRIYMEKAILSQVKMNFHSAVHFNLFLQDNYHHLLFFLGL